MAVLEDFPNTRLLPARYFNPKGDCAGKLRISSDTRGIHHFAASWFNWKQWLAYKIFPKIGVDVGNVKRVGGGSFQIGRSVNGTNAGSLPNSAICLDIRFSTGP